MFLPNVLAILPLVIFTIIMFLGRPILTASFTVFALFLLLALFYWQVDPILALGAMGSGAVSAMDILLIIFGALFFVEILKKKHILADLAKYLESVSTDYRVVVILLVWFLEAFIEGTAGFGIPVALVAPILVSLGFAPVRAVALALLGNSSSVVFGAAGTPIRVGFAGLLTDQVPVYAALFNFSAILVPVAILYLSRKKDADFISGIPMALWAGFCYALPAILVLPLGQELPSILGSIIGLVIFLVSLKIKIRAFPIKLLLPYMILVGLLIVSKFVLKTSVNPGIIFVLSALPFAKDFWPVTKLAVKNALPPFYVVALMATTVQLMGLSGALTIIARGFTNDFLPFLLPFLGAFGAFLTGSATVSNLMFGKIVYLSAVELNLNSQIVLGVLVVGASLGNMFALADMLAAQAIVGLKNQELPILKIVLLPCLLILLVVAVCSLVVSRTV